MPVLQTSIKDDTYPERAAAGLIFGMGCNKGRPVSNVRGGGGGIFWTRFFSTNQYWDKKHKCSFDILYLHFCRKDNARQQFPTKEKQLTRGQKQICNFIVGFNFILFQVYSAICSLLSRHISRIIDVHSDLYLIDCTMRISTK